MQVIARQLMRPLCAAVLGTLPLLSFAADTVLVSAQANVYDLSYRLIDLDPNDGIAPSLTFLPTNGLDLRASFQGNQDWTDNQSAYGSTISGLTPDYTQSVSTHTTSAVMGPSGYTASASLTASQLAYNVYDTGTTNLYLETRSNVSSAPGYSSLVDVVLGANTGLILTGKTSISGSFDQAGIDQTLSSLPNLISHDESFWQGAQANAHIAVTLSEQSEQVYATTGFHNTVSFTQVEAMDMANKDASAFEHIDPFELQYANFGSQDKTIALGIDNWVAATYSGTVVRENPFIGPIPVDPPIIIDPPPTPTIPEPGTYALMSIGLVGLVWARRQRKQP